MQNTQPLHKTRTARIFTKKSLVNNAIREYKFGMDPLTGDEVFDGFPAIFVHIGNNSSNNIGGDAVLDALHALEDNGCLLENESGEFPLTSEGGLAAEEMFETLKMLISEHIELPSIASEPMNATDSEPKSKPRSKPTKSGEERKQRLKKYEDAVTDRLNKLKDGVLQSVITSEKMEEELTTGKFAEHFKKYDSRFKKSEINSIIDRVRRSAAWKNRMGILKEVYGNRPPNLVEAYGEQAYDKDTGDLNVSVVDTKREEYEDLVEAYLRDLQRKVLSGEITSEKFCSDVAELTSKAIAEWIKEKGPAFKDRSLKSIENDVKKSYAWINREEILDTERYR